MPRFVHTLLFVCPECSSPVAISRVTKEKNFELVDAERLSIKCSFCEKSSDVIAVTAKRHYLEEWA
ncbi:MAG: hypothetical protein WBL50_15055 [Candidatus Acidiferrum sp.]